MIKPASIISALVLLLSCGQSENAQTKSKNDSSYSYSLPTPKGWTIEQFPIPISFARSIKYKGVEEIRFAPGWDKINSDDYWSYVYLWSLNGSPEINNTIIEKNMSAYYDGLIASNIQKNGLIASKISPVKASFSKVQTTNNDKETYTGNIFMYDYMAHAPMTLNCIVHVKSCSDQNHTFILHELSPRPLTDSVWQRLNQINTSLTCGTK